MYGSVSMLVFQVCPFVVPDLILHHLKLIDKKTRKICRNTNPKQTKRVQLNAEQLQFQISKQPLKRKFRKLLKNPVLLTLKCSLIKSEIISTLVQQKDT